MLSTSDAMQREKSQTTIEYILVIAFVVALITVIGYFIKSKVLA